MTLAAGFVIRHWGWRAAYLIIGIPMIAIAAPLVALAVRSRPPGSVKLTLAQSAETLPGYEVRLALRTRSFRMIALANFCFAFAATGTAIHMVAHLEHVGYSGSNAVFAMSVIFGFAAIGKVVMGLIADRLTARRALAIDFAIQAAGIVLVFAVRNAVVAPIFVAVYGLTVAAPLMLLPLLTSESLGLIYFGSDRPGANLRCSDRSIGCRPDLRSNQQLCGRFRVVHRDQFAWRAGDPWM